MTINGHAPEPPVLPEPKCAVARWVYEAGIEDGDLAWDELPDDDREALENYALDYLSAHMSWLAKHGFKIIPPGSVLRPKSDEEAAMMTEAVRLYRAAKSRKSGLLAGERKLIIPGKAN